MTTTGLSPIEPLALRQTTVSSPSVIHPKPSQQSITASEDYYSLSGSSVSSERTISANGGTHSANTINRYTTPPSRYRTPLASRDHVALNPSNDLAGPQDVIEEGDEEVRKTPMRGEGKRRQSQSYFEEPFGAGAPIAGPSSMPAAGAALREGGIRRKPVPSQVIESDSPSSQEFIDASRARSSVAQAFDREPGPPTPDHDDTPYIHFALDQLNRDEEVRGSRLYPAGNGDDFVQQYRAEVPENGERQQQRLADEPSAGEFEAAGAGAAGLGVGAAALGIYSHHETDPISRDPSPSQQWRGPSRPFDQPPRPSDEYAAPAKAAGPDLFTYLTNEGRHQPPLDFLPGTLRPLRLIFFILFAVVLLALLLLSAIWSLLHKGLVPYGSFGDGLYFVFEYLPTLLGMLLFIWLVQIEVAVYRIAPFIAMASDSERSREEGAYLRLCPKTFLMPYTGHFRARQSVVGFFMLVSWLQTWSIPLLASSFNVHFYGAGSGTVWRWVATAGLIWAVIGLYILLIISVILLLVWLRRQNTGLRWDPRSLADIIVLIERSNALSMTEEDELRYSAPRLGYYQTTRSGNQTFLTYGIADKSARQYGLEDGRIREKVASPPEPKSRFSDPDMELGREQRHSRERMLPKHLATYEDDVATGGRAVPWFLRPSAALLWAIVAIVLLVAFLVVSYLHQTAISKGFAPAVPAAVDTLGYSGTNFLYSFIPAFLAMVCFLGLLDIDYAYRRLTPYTTLLADDGELAEKSLLLSYAADLPGFVTGSALVNGHFKVAILSLMSLISAAIPVLAGGVFWAQFFVPTQSIQIYAHMPAYYALTAFVTIYALTYLFVFPSRKLRALNHELPRRNRAESFQDILLLAHQSRMLDDVTFHAPRAKIDLVTRLLSISPGSGDGRRAGVGVSANQEAAASKISVADSVRGFGRARLDARELGPGEVPRYFLGRYEGRDGREYVGVDRLRL